MFGVFIKAAIDCASPVAFESMDHVHPYGTKQDNSRNRRFNKKLYALFGGQKIKILDVGCAGGGFVKDCIDDGHFAIGIEGSDYSKKEKRAEWATIPESLFTCDATKDFTIYDADSDGKAPIKFDVITAWEFFEHINRDDIGKVILNLKKHLAENGLIIISTTNSTCVVDGAELHVTKESKIWWINEFKDLGLNYRSEYVRYFNSQWIRGYFENAIDFHLVVGDCNLPVPRENPITRAQDLCRDMASKKAIVSMKKAVFEKIAGKYVP
jgi:2-polyprenyl-3-methyl-5-hydroxy-6-metoxy-1,4-benzoquinol methylase